MIQNSATKMTYVTIYLACLIGYRGKDCAIQCKYPRYGQGCQSLCNCLKNECHYSQGCILHTTTDTYYEKTSMFYGFFFYYMSYCNFKQWWVFFQQYNTI